MNEVVASVTLDGVQSSGEKHTISVQIGKPYQREGAWYCPVALPGLHDRLADIGGEDSFQSLCLAIRFVHALLQHFLESGGRLLDPVTGEDVTLDAYLSTAENPK